MTKTAIIFSTEEMKPGFLLQALLYVWNVQALRLIYLYATIEITFMLICIQKVDADENNDPILQLFQNKCWA